MGVTTTKTTPHKKLRIGGAIALALVGLVVLTLMIAAPITAKLAGDELKAMGFQPKGLETLEVDWWNQHVRLGPVSLARENEPPLGMERLVLHYDLGALWDRRILVHRIEIEGIELSVVREANGAIRLNDVVLPMAAKTPTPVPEPTQSKPWLPGLNQLTLANSRIDFVDEAAGVNASVQLEQVSLENFFGWQPDQSGRYDIAANINDMDLKVSGTAKPFASALAANSKGRLSGISLKRLASLVKLPEFGPLEAGGALVWELQLDLDADMAVRVQSDVRLEGVEANVGDGGAVAKISALALENVNVALDDKNGLDVQIARIGGEGLELNVTEKIATLEMPQSAQEPASQQDEEAKPFRFRVDRVELDNASQITYGDGSLTPPFKVQFDFETLSIENIASDNPDQPTTVALQGKINQFAPVAVTGWVKPLAEQLSFDVNSSLKTLELPAFSSFAAKSVGMHLDGGRLAVDGAGKVVGGQLDAKVDIGLDKLTFTPLSDEDRQKLSDTVGMPVETVIGLLEDGDGHIGITLPVTGDMDKPEFDLSNAINQAVGGAVKAAAGGIFKVLFPPAALISLIAEAEDGSVNFKPAVFPAGQDTLAAATKTHADQLALVLKERPKLGIRMCGRTTGADQAALTAQAYADALAQKVEQAAKADPQATTPQTPPVEHKPQLSADEKQSVDKQVLAKLEEMAVSRARMTKQYLIDQHAIDAGRLAECRSFFDAKDTQAPRVDVTF
ncbi:DUF748 domain-containing protein [Magnetovibrio sp. PR-2]|uniref:DUF748 domain-containing protein n=1 Tax=Magnetovibrio sp. PR-2 TaxID=3120356 RepID=UPI002FCE47CC